MAFQLIPFPISIIFALVFVIAWLAVLWKLRKTGKIYSILFKLSIIAGIILIVAFIYGIYAQMLQQLSKTQLIHHINKGDLTKCITLIYASFLSVFSNAWQKIISTWLNLLNANKENKSSFSGFTKLLYFGHLALQVGLATLKIKTKYSGFITALLMVLVLDTTMTFTMTSVFIGWTPGFIQRFAGAWLIGFAVALPTSLAITPLIRKLVKVICE